ncbi:MAG: hypothetical protein CMQ24_16495 [Gammaproteobacteria bacterium]|nr:hypothetical protein [Gammaproteobacteria bacterium]
MSASTGRTTGASSTTARQQQPWQRHYRCKAPPVAGATSTTGRPGIDADTADDARATFGVGELGYWPPGDAFCIFFGQTPASSGDEPVMASAGNPIGWITDDVTALRGTTGGASIEVRRA